MPSAPLSPAETADENRPYKPYGKQALDGLKAIYHALKTQLSALAATYGLFASLYVIGHYTIGERLWVISLLNNLAPWVTGLAWLSLPLVFLSSHWRVWAALHLPALLAFIIWFAPLFEPPFTPPTFETPIRVATFNIKNMGDPDAIMDIIRAIDADIIALQEAPIETTAALLTEQYPYIATLQYLTLASRYPIVDGELVRVEEQWRGSGYVEPNRIVTMRVLIEIEGQPVAVYNSHPMRPLFSIRPTVYESWRRRLSTFNLVRAIQKENYPILLLCDCNMADKTDDYKQIDRYLNDAWQEVGSGFGFTAPNNIDDIPFRLLRSDYIWYSDAFVPVAVETWPESATADHLPVVATIGLK